MAKVSEKCLRLIKNQEGGDAQDGALDGVFHAYWDKLGKVWTIGYGHTGDVKPGQALTEAQAHDLLCRDMERFEKGVENLLVRSATPGQFDAMVSLAYNIGLGTKEPPRGFTGSTLLKKFNAGDIEGAAAEFAEWNVADGVIQRGLVRRRAKEMIRFLGGN